VQLEVMHWDKFVGWFRK